MQLFFVYRCTVNAHTCHHLNLFKLYSPFKKTITPLYVKHSVWTSATPSKISLKSSTFGFRYATLAPSTQPGENIPLLSGLHVLYKRYEGRLEIILVPPYELAVEIVTMPNLFLLVKPNWQGQGYDILTLCNPLLRDLKSNLQKLEANLKRNKNQNKKKIKMTLRSKSSLPSQQRMIGLWILRNVTIFCSALHH